MNVTNDGITLDAFQPNPIDFALTNAVILEDNSQNKSPRDSLVSEIGKNVIGGQSEDKAVEQPKNDVVEQPKNDDIEQPKSDVVGQPKNDDVEQPKNDIVEQPKNDIVEQPKNDVVEQPKNDDVEQPKNDVVEQPKNDDVEQPKNDDVEQPKNVDQSKKPVNKPKTTLVGRIKAGFIAAATKALNVIKSIVSAVTSIFLAPFKFVACLLCKVGGAIVKVGKGIVNFVGAVLKTAMKCVTAVGGFLGSAAKKALEYKKLAIVAVVLVVSAINFTAIRSKLKV